LTVRCSLRLPPTPSEEAARKSILGLVDKLKAEGRFDSTYGAEVEIKIFDIGNGFNAPKLPEDISNKLD